MKKGFAIHHAGFWLVLTLVGFSLAPGTLWAADPVTAADCANFGRQLEASYNHHNHMYLVNAFDFDALTDNSIPRDLRSDLDGEEFQNGLRQGIEMQLAVLKSFKFLKVAPMDGQNCALMRVISTNGAVNYENLFVARDSSGRMRIKDVYIYVTGEKLSETERRLIIPVLQEKNKSTLDRLFGDSPDIIKYAPQWERMFTLVQHGEYQTALDAYSQLPPSLQGEKFVLIQQMRAAQNASPTAYVQALELWRQRYPHDASADLVSIDYYFLTKQYARALENIDRLDAAVGGDPYLDFNRAVVYLLMKDEVNEEKFARQAVEREPDLLVAGFLTVRLLNGREDYPGCVQILELMHSGGGYPKSALDRGLRSNPAYAALLESGVYTKWYSGWSPGQDPGLTPMLVPARPPN